MFIGDQAGLKLIIQKQQQKIDKLEKELISVKGELSWFKKMESNAQCRSESYKKENKQLQSELDQAVSLAKWLSERLINKYYENRNLDYHHKTRGLKV